MPVTVIGPLAHSYTHTGVSGANQGQGPARQTSRSHSKNGASGRKTFQNGAGSKQKFSSKVQIPLIMINSNAQQPPNQPQIAPQSNQGRHDPTCVTQVGSNKPDSISGLNVANIKKGHQSAEASVALSLSTGQPYASTQKHSVSRSASKVNTKHRKLSRQPSAVVPRESVALSSQTAFNNQEPVENQYFKLKTSPSKQTKHLQKEIAQTVASGGLAEMQKFQKLMAQNQFSGLQPEFLVAGQASTQSSQGVYSQVGIIVPSNARSGGQKEAPNLFSQDKQARTFTKKQTTPSGFGASLEHQATQPQTDEQAASIKKDSSTLASGFTPQTSAASHAQQSLVEFSRQQQFLQQQIRQQQNFKQHMQSVQLEVTGNVPSTKGSTVVQASGALNKSAVDSQQQMRNPNTVTGQAGVVAQQVSFGPMPAHPSNLNRTVKKSQSSPKTGDSSYGVKNIFVHNPAQGAVAGAGAGASGSPSSSNQATTAPQPLPQTEKKSGGALDDLRAQNSQSIGLQNSHSPFKSKQSQKNLRGSATSQYAATGSDCLPGVASEGQQQQWSPTITTKKQKLMSGSKVVSKKQSSGSVTGPSASLVTSGRVKGGSKHDTKGGFKYSKGKQGHSDEVMGSFQYQYDPHSLGQQKTLGVGVSTFQLPANSHHVRLVPQHLPTNSSGVKNHAAGVSKVQAANTVTDFASSPLKTSTLLSDHSDVARGRGKKKSEAILHQPPRQAALQAQNMSGLLNMSKQRAYADANPGMVITDQSQQQIAHSDLVLTGQTSSQIGQPSSSLTSTQKHGKQTRSDSQQSRRGGGSNSQSLHHSQAPSFSQANNGGPIYVHSHHSGGGKQVSSQKKQSIPGHDVSFQTSGKQIVQGQQSLLTAHGPTKNVADGTKLQQQTSQPISVFEMQFYQGDFLVGSNHQQPLSGQSRQAKAQHSLKPQVSQEMGTPLLSQGGKMGNLGFIPAGTKIMGHTVVAQISQQVQAAAKQSSQPLTSQSFLTKNGLQAAKVTPQGSPVKGSALSQADAQLQQAHIERQKANQIALHNFHQQWLSSHGGQPLQSQNQNAAQAPPSQSLRNAQSSTLLVGPGAPQPPSSINRNNVQLQATHPQQASPQKQSLSASKHQGHHPLAQGANTNLSYAHHHAHTHALGVLHAKGGHFSHHSVAGGAFSGPVQLINTVPSQSNLNGATVSINGRQMPVTSQQMPMAQAAGQQQQQSLVATPSFTQMTLGPQPNFGALRIPLGAGVVGAVAPSGDQTQGPAQVFQVAGNGSDPTALQVQFLDSLTGTPATTGAHHLDQFSHQLYAMQLQQHHQALTAQQANERVGAGGRRRDTGANNTIFRRVTSKIPFENAYVEDCYKFIIGYGNNSNLIRNALKARSWWIEIQPVHSMFNFKWNPVSEGIKFARLGHTDHAANKRDQSGTTMGQKSYQKEGAKETATTQDKVNQQMVNHFENHQLITEKYNLLMVMQRYCDLHKENTFDLMPITFFVEIADASKDQLVTQALQPFTSLYQALETNKDKLMTLKDQLIRQLHQKIDLEEQEQVAVSGGAKPNQTLQDKIQRLESVTGAQLSQPQNSGKITKFKAFNFEKRTYQKFTMPLCHFDSFNLWLLKPTHLNRGRGIHVFRDLETLNRLIKQYCSGKEEGHRRKGTQEQDKKESGTGAEKGDGPDAADNEQQNNNINNNGFDTDLEDATPQNGNGPPQALNKSASSPAKAQKAMGSKIKHNTFIIQKYVERPLLIFKRKFDIRVWVLLDQDYELHFFKEGYLRTSSTEFGIDLQNIDDAFVHLTNNAVQKHAENYGDHEDGNMLSFPQFQNYIDEHYPEAGVSVYDHLVPQMHEVIIKTFNAVRRTIDPQRRKHCFELFGYDFILDEDFNSWLIEVNTNPCLEESSDLLKRLLPRMIEDMFKLTVDVLFPKSSIRKRKDFKKKGSSPQKTKTENFGTSPQKRVNTANKLSVQLQSTEERIRYKAGGGTTDSEQTPICKEGLGAQGFGRPKTNSVDANKANTETTKPLTNGNESAGADFTSQAAFSQSLPDSTDATGAALIGESINQPGAGGPEVLSKTAVAHESPLMTIKEKLGRGRTHPVPGYTDSENMWHKIGNLDKEPSYSTKHPNNKSVYTIQVQDKLFKLRKNPAYTGPLNLPELKPDPAELLLLNEDEEGVGLNDEGTAENGGLVTEDGEGQASSDASR